MHQQNQKTLEKIELQAKKNIFARLHFFAGIFARFVDIFAREIWQLGLETQKQPNCASLALNYAIELLKSCRSASGIHTLAKAPLYFHIIAQI